MAYHLEKIYPIVTKKLEEDNSLNLLKEIELPEDIIMKRKCFWKCLTLPKDLKKRIPKESLE